MRYMLLFLLGFLFTGSVHAQDSGWSGKLDLDLLSSYVGVPSGIRLDDEPAFQPSFTVGYTDENGTFWYGNVWAQMRAFGPEFSSDAASELDYTIGVFHAFESGTYVDVSASFFDVVPSLKIEDEDGAQIGLELGREVARIGDESVEWRLSPYVRVEPQFPFASGERGANVWLGARQKFDFGDSIELGINTGFVHLPGVYGDDTGFVGHVRLQLDIPVSEHVTTGPIAKVSHPLSDFDDGRETEGVIGWRLSFTF